MDNIEIPEDFYVLNTGHHIFLCHKSCIWSDHMFSNQKNVCLCTTSDIDSYYFNILRNICNMCDEVEENTYFIDDKFNDLEFNISKGRLWIHLFVCGASTKNFSNAKSLLEYLAKNYPECMRNNDIKIALKD